MIDDILLGVLGRAQRLYPVEICGFSFLSSHYHLLLWPGISMLKAVLDGEPIRGTWFNRTQEYRARLRRKKKDSKPESFPSEETVALSQLPCWRHLSPEVYRELVAGTPIHSGSTL